MFIHCSHCLAVFYKLDGGHRHGGGEHDISPSTLPNCKSVCMYYVCSCLSRGTCMHLRILYPYLGYMCSLFHSSYLFSLSFSLYFTYSFHQVSLKPTGTVAIQPQTGIFWSLEPFSLDVRLSSLVTFSPFSISRSQ